jgi:hypothetical protein
MDEIELNLTKTPSDFMLEIDKIAEDNRLNYIDAVLYFCEKNGVEVETAAALIKGSAKMKAKVQSDAEEQNYLPKTRTLPL